MSWIRLVDYAGSTGRLRQVYDRVRGPRGEIDNILAVHSLRPHTLSGHMALYKNVLHHTANSLPTWLLELIGIAVSGLNGCDYCVDHHAAGMRRLLGDDATTDRLLAAIRSRDYRAIGPREAAMLAYAKRLTLDPASVTEADLEPMRAAGLDDGEILEVNQVVAYFSYANR
ncbi:MAG TPA: peroxidase-related enzyme, partial [Candidatus Limnocylindrales bacterium]|nr:peroxidase-related enzyme [Candidatus Limnocylindrales bacterium]